MEHCFSFSLNIIFAKPSSCSRWTLHFKFKTWIIRISKFCYYTLFLFGCVDSEAACNKQQRIYYRINSAGYLWWVVYISGIPNCATVCIRADILDNKSRMVVIKCRIHKIKCAKISANNNSDNSWQTVQNTFDKNVDYFG